MAGLVLGDLRIEPIVEGTFPTYAPSHLLVDLPDDAVAASMEWLSPRYYDVATDTLKMSFHSWLVRTPRHNILIDTCFGNDKSRPGVMIGDHLSTPWLNELAKAGLRPEDIDYVMCTHLHVDHVGWNTRLIDGRWVPTFPNAKYVFSRQEFEYWDPATGPATGGMDSAVTFADSVLPCVEAGQVALVEDGFTLSDNLTLELAVGHSHGHCVIRGKGAGRAVTVGGDIVHTPLQIAYPDVNTIACALPEEARSTRRKILGACAESGEFFLPAHFPAPHYGHIAGTNGRSRFIEAGTS